MVSIHEQNPFNLPEDEPCYEPDWKLQPDIEQDELDTPSGDVILSVEGVSKKFCRSLRRSLFYGMQDIAAEMVASRRTHAKLRSDEFWALKDVSMKLHQGQALGLIGANGSGKTTLLRIISGLIKPDAGSVRIRGRVAPLIALGAGFSPVLTGRENIYANMSILGLSNQEINRLFDEVVEFAEIGEALDAPVRSYSSGMAARLGFACAIHTHPDILLIDEVLVVGDVRFKIKCYRKLYELRQAGTSFIMVSHAAGMISTICQQAVYLQKGRCMAYGDAMTVINQYEEDLCLGQSQAELGQITIAPKSPAESMGLDIVGIGFRDANGNPIDSPTSGDYTCLTIECQCAVAIDQVSLVIDIREMAGEGQTLLYMNSADEGVYLQVSPGKCQIQIQMPNLGLGMGLYDARIAIRMQKLCLLDKLESFKFAVKKAPSQSNNSLFYQARQWQVARSQ